jgi:hypothetical protein
VGYEDVGAAVLSTTPLSVDELSGDGDDGGYV